MFTSRKKDPMSDLKSAAKDIGSAAGAAAEETRANLEFIAGKAGRKARRLLDSAGNDLEQAAGKVQMQIRRYPLQSGLAALGVGIVLGLLLRR